MGPGAHAHRPGRSIGHAVAFDIFDQGLFQKVDAPEIRILHAGVAFVKGAAGHPWVGMLRRPVANISPDGPQAV